MSNNVITSDPLVSFLYELMRDHVVPGTVEKIVQEDRFHLEEKREISLSNGYLAQYAEDVAARLRK